MKEVIIDDEEQYLVLLSGSDEEVSNDLKKINQMEKELKKGEEE